MAGGVGSWGRLFAPWGKCRASRVSKKELRGEVSQGVYLPFIRADRSLPLGEAGVYDPPLWGWSRVAKKWRERSALGGFNLGLIRFPNRIPSPFSSTSFPLKDRGRNDPGTLRGERCWSFWTGN